jgi:hypothetical protein
MRLLIAATAAAIVLSLVPAATFAQAPSAAQVSKSSAGLVLSYGAWGKLKLGMTAKQAQRTGMVSKQADHCAPGYEMVKKYQHRGFVVWKGKVPAMKVDQIIITGAKEHTTRSIHVGSTLNQLRKAYPKLSKVFSASQVTGEQQSGDDLHIAFSSKAHHGVLGFQFAYGKKPKGSSKIQTIIVAPKRTVFWGC